MDSLKILEVIGKYRQHFKEKKIIAIDFPHQKKPRSRKEKLGHCYGMLDKMEGFVRESRIDKVFRWLGFIQGCLWTLGHYSLKDLENHNRPFFPATLCYPVREKEVLLGLKKQKIGQGCWNGFGGRVEEGETPRQAAARELKEEVGLIVSPECLEKVAIIDFYNEQSDGSFLIFQVHVYLAHQWIGEPKATKEMSDPTWFNLDWLPIENMMLADKEWLPFVLEGKKIIARAKYGPFQKILLGEIELQGAYFFPDEQGPIL